MNREMEEALSELLSNLHLDNERNGSLMKLNSILSTLSLRELEEISPHVSLKPLFDCLNTSDGNQIESVSIVLGKILSTLSPTFLLNNYDAELERGLSHPNTDVRQLTMKELLRCTEHGSTNILLGNTSVIEKLITLLADDNMTVTKHCSKIIVNIAQSENGLQVLFSNQILETMDSVMAKSDVIRFRVYEVIVHVSKQSEQGFKMCLKSNMITRLVAELNYDDILIQLNCLELLSELAQCLHGIRYLDRHGVIRNLENKLDRIDSNSLSGFLEPGLIKFFGCIAYLQPKEVCTGYPIFLKKLFELLQSKDLSASGIAFETIGLLGSTVEGKMVLGKLGDAMVKAMGSLASVLQSSSSEVKIKALNAMENLFDLKQSEQTTELISVLKTWYDAAVKDTTTKLVTLMQAPFDDLRTAAMQVIQVIAKLPWGQIYLNDYPGFIEYLLDRSTESGKVCKELKYSIIRVLAESPTTQNTMGNIVLLRVKEYVRDGPFYVPTESTVAVEGSN